MFVKDEKRAGKFLKYHFNSCKKHGIMFLLPSCAFSPWWELPRIQILYVIIFKIFDQETRVIISSAKAGINEFCSFNLPEISP